MPALSRKSLNSALVNAGPLSETMISGRPNVENSERNFEVVVDEEHDPCVENTSIHFE